MLPSSSRGGHVLALTLIILLGLATLPARATPGGIHLSSREVPSANVGAHGAYRANPRALAGTGISSAQALTSTASQWEPFFLQQDAAASKMVNDGTTIYALGRFQSGLEADVLGKWDATSQGWSMVPGPNGAALTGVTSLALEGRKLYVGGSFNVNGSHVVVLDSASGKWSPRGTNLCCTVEALAVAGDELYALGSFGLAQWDSVKQSWVMLITNPPVGGMPPSPPTNTAALAITADSVYTAWINFGPQGPFSISRWDKATRTKQIVAPTQMTLAVGIFAYLDQIYVVNDSSILRWDRAANRLDTVMTIGYSVTAAILVGQSLFIANAVAVHRYDLVTGQLTSLGTGVVPHGGGMTFMAGKLYASVLRPTSRATEPNTGVSVWDPATATWSHPQRGIRGVEGIVRVLQPRGTDLYVGGKFSRVDKSYNKRFLVRFDTVTDTWHDLPGLPIPVADTATWVVEQTPASFYVGGDFLLPDPGIKYAGLLGRYDFADGSWHVLGGDIDGTVTALLVHGEDLYVGGGFSHIGGITTMGIARYHIPSGTWHKLGNGLTSINDLSSVVYDLELIGDDLYVGGTFDVSGLGSGLARWNISSETWHGVARMQGTVFAIEVHGTNLYAGGSIPWSGFRAYRIEQGKYIFFYTVARLDLQTGEWHGLGEELVMESGTFMPTLRAITASGGDLYLAGNFTRAGQMPAVFIARWSLAQQRWVSMENPIIGGELQAGLSALAEVNGWLYVGGSSFMLGDVRAESIARYRISAAAPAPSVWLPLLRR